MRPVRDFLVADACHWIDEFHLDGSRFDAESLYTPCGCIAQAWSVAEVLRCLVKTSS